MLDRADLFLAKALESLTGAESKLANGRYNNSANRAYYACYQAAVAALCRAGVRPPGGGDEWSHSFVAAQFTACSSTGASCMRPSCVTRWRTTIWFACVPTMRTSPCPRLRRAGRCAGPATSSGL